MIKKRITKDALSLTLTPNKSSTVQQNLIFFGFLSVLCLTFAIGFFVLGATMILPFAGLEIMLLFIILRVNRNWLNQSEKIYLDKLYVKLEKGKNIIFLVLKINSLFLTIFFMFIILYLPDILCIKV